MTDQAADRIEIVPYAQVAGDAAAMAALDDVFFSSSNTKSFPDEAARSAFRERWLGRYLTSFADSCFVAVTGTGDVAGYICGSLRDPARDPHFADQPHFAAFADVTPKYPAQLHVNVAEQLRGHGVGKLLIAAFVAHVRANGIHGAHAISSRGARNLPFYAANGFLEVSAATVNGHELVFLARELA